ncbi:MAG: GDSL-type esterase/lipase family protein [Phycisphaeraceae bacterium]
MLMTTGTPIPVWGCALAPLLVGLWLVIEGAGHRGRRIARVLLVVAIVAAGVHEWPYYAPPRLEREPFDRVMIVADSVTAGIGAAGEVTWAVLLAERDGLEVVDASVAGATVRTALAEQVPWIDGVGAGLVIVQIGGNDMLYGVPPTEFEAALDELLDRLSAPGRRLVMFELPAFPFQVGHTRIQRRVAARHDVVMIPRRYFLWVIRPGEATRDGVHLTDAGHRRMLAVVEAVLEP